MENCIKDGNKLKRQYHGFTRGFIINELVRRIHPDGKTIGQILKDEIKIDGIHLGENVSSVYPVKKMTENYVMKQCLIPKWAGKELDMTLPGLVLRTVLHIFCKFNKTRNVLKSKTIILERMEMSSFNFANYQVFIQKHTVLFHSVKISFRFYVKSTLENLEILKLPFLPLKTLRNS